MDGLQYEMFDITGHEGVFAALASLSIKEIHHAVVLKKCCDILVGSVSL